VLASSVRAFRGLARECEAAAGERVAYLANARGPGCEKSLRDRYRELDLLLGGGIPRRQTLMVTGSPGCGKTIVVSQIAFLAAARGVPVVYSTVTSEPNDGA
jgi:predicted ATP-dependent serine protease